MQDGRKVVWSIPYVSVTFFHTSITIVCTHLDGLKYSNPTLIILFNTIYSHTFELFKYIKNE